jgi:hypothetical protein
MLIHNDLSKSDHAAPRLQEEEYSSFQAVSAQADGTSGEAAPRTEYAEPYSDGGR